MHLRIYLCGIHRERERERETKSERERERERKRARERERERESVCVSVCSPVSACVCLFACFGLLLCACVSGGDGGWSKGQRDTHTHTGPKCNHPFPPGHFKDYPSVCHDNFSVPSWRLVSSSGLHLLQTHKYAYNIGIPMYTHT